MKTLQKKENVVRVKEEKVDEYLNSGYELCPKSVWKEKVRDVSKKEEKKNKKK